MDTVMHGSLCSLNNGNCAVNMFVGTYFKKR